MKKPFISWCQASSMPFRRLPNLRAVAHCWAMGYCSVRKVEGSGRVIIWKRRKMGANHLSKHDDVIKWKHFPRFWPFVRGIHRLPVNSPHKGQWRGAFMFSLICAWSNGWVNNVEAGDLRPHRAHDDVIVDWLICFEVLRNPERPCTTTVNEAGRLSTRQRNYSDITW